MNGSPSERDTLRCIPRVCLVCASTPKLFRNPTHSTHVPRFSRSISPRGAKRVVSGKFSQLGIPSALTLTQVDGPLLRRRGNGNQAGSDPIISVMITVFSTEHFSAPAVLDATGTEAMLEWTELLAAFRHKQLHGGPLIDAKRLKRALSGNGVPASLRAEVWLTFSGASERMHANPGLYEELSKGVEGDTQCTSTTDSAGHGHANQHAHLVVLEQIEKDLRRTEIGSDGGKLCAMRRVLCAFASHKPSIGYVQGMNFIVVALLGVFDEAATFWMLSLIVDAWLPDHFSASLMGSQIDARVLSILTAEHLPALAKRLHDLDVTVQVRKLHFGPAGSAWHDRAQLAGRHAPHRRRRAPIAAAR